MIITVRLEYGGMRAERSATDLEQARRQLAEMYANHGITPTKSDPMRGRNQFGTRSVARFI
jgi:hypothetical protein